MAEKTLRTVSSTKTATTLMAYAQLEVDNSSTCIPRSSRSIENFLANFSSSFRSFRLCQFSIVRVVLNRTIDGGDSNAIVIAVKIQVISLTFSC